MKILIADDDRASLMMMKRVLVQKGFDVSTASDGKAAVACIGQEGGPRLVLLDWMMPSLSGLDVCRTVRSQTHGGYVYIILLTARDTKEDIIAGLGAGADDFLTKPCHPEELSARLRTGQRILALEDRLVEARDEMSFRASYDALTRIYNRGTIVQALSQELAKPTRPEGAFAILLCDVDHFKKINDTFGHPVGDEVLCAVARRLESIKLFGDQVGRFGGEEFMLLLHDVDITRLDAVGKNICDVVNTSPISTSSGDLSVSVSVGILGINSTDYDRHQDELLSTVDELLYQAKRGGRNRAVSGACGQRTKVGTGELSTPHHPPCMLPC